jgi:hypothetical protein
MDQQKQHITDIVFVLSLFCVFAILALFVVVLGANVYEGISENMTRNYNARTSVSYITEKIRQNDNRGDIAIERIGGGGALVLTHTQGEDAYETWIYVNDGQLRETTVREGAEVKPGDGQPIMELRDMSVEYNGARLIRVTALDLEGNEFGSTISIKSGGE